jgi:hypothetical protein
MWAFADSIWLMERLREFIDLLACPVRSVNNSRLVTRGRLAWDGPAEACPACHAHNMVWVKVVHAAYFGAIYWRCESCVQAQVT